MLKKKSSVKISIEGNTEKNLQVPTFLLLYWKQIAISIVALLVISIGTIAYIASEKKAEIISAEYQAKLDKVKNKNKKLNNSQLEVLHDINQAKKSFNQIDSTIEIINGKMRKRGLKTIALANVGGPVEKDDENIVMLSEYYKDLLKNMDKKISSMPMGRPHNGRITSRFSYRANPFTRRGREKHSGVDFKGRIGDPVRSTADGTVIFAGYEGGYGNVVKIKHKYGYETRYAHLVRTKVKPGQHVGVGTIIGLLGNTGRSTGAHIHYEILKDNKKVNPESYFEF